MLMLDIPYEAQEDRWKCGPASLAMVYRSFGLTVRQADLWPESKGMLPERIARHAQEWGFATVLLRAARPWELLQDCFAKQLRVIVIHRMTFGGTGWHASVLRGLNESEIVLHDPGRGPDRQLSRADFLALWGPSLWSLLATGFLLVAISRDTVTDLLCPCGQQLPELVPCPRCGRSIPWQPGTVLGCGKACSARHWSALYCTSCVDYVTFD